MMIENGQIEMVLFDGFAALLERLTHDDGPALFANGIRHHARATRIILEDQTVKFRFRLQVIFVRL